MMIKVEVSSLFLQFDSKFFLVVQNTRNLFACQKIKWCETQETMIEIGQLTKKTAANTTYQKMKLRRKT
jgi:hypothetical protein